MSRDPREAFLWLESIVLSCGACGPDMDRAMESVRTALDRLSNRTDDPLQDAADALHRAEAVADRHYHGAHGEAYRREIVSAAVSVGRALALRG